MDNINDIISSLSAEDIDMLKGVASSILGDSDSTANAQQQQPQQVQNQNMLSQLSSLNLNSDDFNMIMKAKGIFERMNSASSKNADLINALKPHLSEQSRQRADQAIRILKLFDVLPYLKDLF